MKRIVFALAVVLLLTSLQVFSQERNERYNMQKRSEQREMKRFTLKEWMESKDRRALMDMWLSLNTPSPYEFSLSGTFLQYDLESSTAGVSVQTARKSTEGSFSAYATLVGVTGEYQNNIEEGFNDVTGMFNLRLMGRTIQGTNLTLHYGLRTRTQSGGGYRLNQNFPALTLNLYMTKYFGIEGHYRYFMPTSESFYGDTTADELNAGAFVDFGPVQIFGRWYQERQSSDNSGIQTGIKRTGTKAGVKIFF